MSALDKIFTKKPKSNISVNLLPQDSFTRSPIGKVLTWSLTTGRYLVIFTELIVILTFLSRFALDRQLTDLNKSITSKQTRIEAYEDLETKARDVQKKTEFISQLNSRVKALELIDFLSANTPESIQLDKLSVSADGFALESSAHTPLVLNIFVDNIRSDSRFSEVVLSKISTSEDNTSIVFSITAKYSK